MLLPVLLFATLCVVGCELSPFKSKTQFPRILWTYWDGNIEDASVLVKLCLNNMMHYSKASGWEFRFVTKSNYSHFLSPKTKVVLEKLQQQTKLSPTSFSDIMRLLLLHDNGGLYLDASTLLYRNLSWIDSHSEHQFFDNKVTNDPEMILFTSNYYKGGDRTVVYDEQLLQNIIIYPGIQNYALLSIAESRFLKDVVKTLT